MMQWAVDPDQSAVPSYPYDDCKRFHFRVINRSWPAPLMDTSVTNRQIPRFAVGVFDSWYVVHEAARDLSNGFTVPHNMSCLGLERILVHWSDAEHAFDTSCMIEMPFPGELETIFCTAGPVAERIKKSANAGVPTLEAALNHWLIARHAAQLSEAVHGGKIIDFVQLSNDDDERRAYRCLLARSCHSVGVHDLIGD